MNFYIFNSKKSLKYFTFIVMGTFIASNIILDIALQYYVDKKTNKFSFLNEKVSKAEHMKLQDNANELDYIFVGSSNTLYNVSTQQFKDHRLKVYNFSSSDRALVDYPYMLQEAISLKPKHIIIGIPIDAPFHGEFGNYKNTTLIDLKYIYKYLGISQFSKATLNYIKLNHLLFKHSEPINIRLSQTYRSFDPKVQNSTIEGTVTQTEKKGTPKADCDIFNYNYTRGQRIVAKCTNGDGILFGNTIDDTNHTEQLDKLDQNYLTMLNNLLDNIKRNNIVPIIIFVPLLKKNLNYNILMIKEKIHAKVIDLTKMYIEEENWADTGHLNVKGRTIYTKKLIEVLQE